MTHHHTTTAAPATWADMDTATRLAAIRVLASQGLTGADMALQLRTTRSAVLGAAYRGKVSIGGGVSRMVRHPDQGRVARPAFRVLPPVPPEVWAPIDATRVEPSARATFAPDWTLHPVSSPTRKQCCWPVGEATGAQQMYCGAPRSRQSYCEHHAAMAFRPDNTNHIAAENAMVNSLRNETHPGAGPTQAREAVRVAFGRWDVVGAGDE